jgi:hypothetical protein
MKALLHTTVLQSVFSIESFASEAEQGGGDLLRRGGLRLETRPVQASMQDIHTCIAHDGEAHQPGSVKAVLLAPVVTGVAREVHAIDGGLTEYHLAVRDLVEVLASHLLSNDRRHAYRSHGPVQVFV